MMQSAFPLTRRREKGREIKVGGKGKREAASLGGEKVEMWQQQLAASTKKGGKKGDSYLFHQTQKGKLREEGGRDT